MNGFETGSDMEDPFADEEASDLEESTESGAESEEQDAQASDDTTDPESEIETTDDHGSDVPALEDIDVTRTQTMTRLAEALMVPEYHEEDPPLPYAAWREGTSTGRRRTTLELNREIDKLVRQAQDEFIDEYDTEITKADIRELALVYGLTHLDDVFTMAEEWGLQYE